MTDDQVDQAIRAFQGRVVEIERVLDAMSAVLGMQPECALREAIFGLVGDQLALLDAAGGVDGWLEWWWLECGLGNRPMGAAPAGGKMRLVATLDDLVRIVLEHRAAAGKTIS